jgi:hypothetical protein
MTVFRFLRGPQINRPVQASGKIDAGRYTAVSRGWGVTAVPGRAGPGRWAGI